MINNKFKFNVTRNIFASLIFVILTLNCVNGSVSATSVTKSKANYENGILSIKYKYDTKTDFCIQFKQSGVNNIMAIYKLSTVPNTSNLFTGTTLQTSVTDWVGPLEVSAVNNGDPNATTSLFSGGWHGTNQDGTGNPTARMISCRVFVDNVEISESSNTIECDNVRLEVINRIKGYNTYNTIPSREIIEEKVIYTIHENKVDVDVEMTPLENVRINRYYGLQVQNNLWDDKVIYKNGKDGDVGVSSLLTSDSGTKTSFPNVDKIIMTSGSSNPNHKIEAWLDRSYGTGTMTNVSNTSPCAFTTSYRKSYFNQINIWGTPINTTQKVQWRGGYVFSNTVPIPAPKADTIMFSDNFNRSDLENLSPPCADDKYYAGTDKWSTKYVPTNSKVIIAKDPTDNSNYCLQLSGAASGNYYPDIRKWVNLSGSKSIIEGKLHISSGVATYPYMSIFHTSSGQYNLLRFNSDNKLQAGTNWAVIGDNYTKDSWTKFSIIIDPSTTPRPTYEYYINGIKTANSTNIDSNLQTNMSTTNVQFAAYIGWAGAEQKTYYDDIKIYKATDLILSSSQLQDVSINGGVKVNFNHTVKQATLIKENFVVADSNNQIVPISSLTPDPSSADSVTINFANPLQFSSSYTISAPGVVDILGNQSEQNIVIATSEAQIISGAIELYKNSISESNKISKFRSGVMYAKVNVENQNNHQIDATLIMALYKSGKLQQIKVLPETVEMSSSKSVETQMTIGDISNNPNDYLLKVFLWKNFGSMSNMTNSCEFEGDTSLATTDGFLAFEAENLPYNNANFELSSGADMSGGKGLSVTNEDKTTPAKAAQPDIDLSFTADKTGPYSIWIRSKNTENSDGNSVFLSLNNGDYAYTVLKGTPTTFGWTKLGVVTVNAGSVGSVRLIRRQKYSIVLDKFVITENALFIPQDIGGYPNIVNIPNNAFPTPSITPPTAHPRLMFTSTDIQTIKANLTAEQNKSAYSSWQRSLSTAINSNLTAPTQAGGTNYNYYILATIEGLAFDYAINGNVENGKKAVEYMKNYSNTVVFDSSALVDRMKGPVIFTISEVYDWCYPLLSDSDKKAFVAFVEKISKDLEVSYPPSQQGAVSGHGGEQSLFHDLLGFGIATYNERPDIYNYCAGRILSQFVPARNFMYTSNTHNQGNAYGTGRGAWEIWSALLFKKMSGQDVFSSDQQYFPYGWLYSRRPDGQAFRMGDDFWEASGKGTYWVGWYPTLFGVANYYNDPYLKREYAREAPMMASFVSDGSLSPVTLLALNNTSLAGKPTTELPLSKYFASPKGMMIARTGWNDGVKSPDAMAVMNISEHWGANHNHLDAGSFQLYYKGILASESGSYSDGYATSHDINYNKRGIAHNILTIYDPNENMTIWGGTISNDGGQVYPTGGAEPQTLEEWNTPAYDTGNVLGHEFGPDPIKPEYTYIKGDITKAYSDKVTGVIRSMVFLPLEDADHPAAMIIMDKIDSTNADFNKSWLLHTQEEPTVVGNKTTVTRTQKGYNGKMVVETLLPKNPTIEKIGGEGKQFWIDGTNYGVETPDATTSDSEGVGWGRVAISPSIASQTDYFLNVLSVSDNNASIADLPSTLIEGDTFVGAVISNRVAIFGKNANRMETEIRFAIPGTGNYKVFVSSIKAGTWTTADGQEVIVTQDGGAAYFNVNAGEVVLTYKNTNTIKPVIVPTIDTTDNVGIRINKSFIYSDVKPVIISDITLMPYRVIFENLGATVTYNEATGTATAIKGNIEVKLIKDSMTAYVNGVAKQLVVPAKLINGEFMVPVKFVSESIGATVTWDQYANLFDISL